jgi:hypothetical protein
MNYTKRRMECRHCRHVQLGWANITWGMSPGNAILLNGGAQNANREIGVPGVKSPRFVPRVGCYLSGVLTGPLRINLPCLIRSGSFSDSLARQKRTWRGINFLSLTGVLFPACSQESPPPIPALHET